MHVSTLACDEGLACKVVAVTCGLVPAAACCVRVSRLRCDNGSTTVPLCA